jgi:uncharacterized membrane protein
MHWGESMMKAWGIFVGAGALLLAAGRPATADMSACNHTNQPIFVAVTGTPTDARDALSTSVSMGWWRVEPSGCHAVLTELVPNQSYYILVRDDHGFWANISRDTRQRRPSRSFCYAPADDFDFFDLVNKPGPCARHDYYLFDTPSGRNIVVDLYG